MSSGRKTSNAHSWFPKFDNRFLAKGHQNPSENQHLNSRCRTTPLIPRWGLFIMDQKQTSLYHKWKGPRHYIWVETQSAGRLSIESIQGMCHCWQRVNVSPMSMFGYIDCPNSEAFAIMSDHAKIVYVWGGNRPSVLRNSKRPALKFHIKCWRVGEGFMNIPFEALVGWEDDIMNGDLSPIKCCSHRSSSSKWNGLPLDMIQSCLHRL